MKHSETQRSATWNIFPFPDIIYWIFREKTHIISLHSSFPRVEQMKKNFYFKDSREV